MGNKYDYLQVDKSTPETKLFRLSKKLCSIPIIEVLENLNKLVPLESQVKAVSLQDKLGKQNFHEDMKKIFEPVTKSIKNISEEVTKTMTENSTKKKQNTREFNRQTFRNND